MPQNQSVTSASAPDCRLPHFWPDSPARGEDLFEMPGRVQQRSEADAQHSRVFAVQQQCAVQHVQEEQQVVRRREGARHGREHRAHQLENETNSGSTVPRNNQSLVE